VSQFAPQEFEDFVSDDSAGASRPAEEDVGRAVAFLLSETLPT